MDSIQHLGGGAHRDWRKREQPTLQFAWHGIEQFWNSCELLLASLRNDAEASNPPRSSESDGLMES